MQEMMALWDAVQRCCFCKERGGQRSESRQESIMTVKGYRRSLRAVKKYNVR
jgi:hypothetical protein